MLLHIYIGKLPPWEDVALTPLRNRTHLNFTLWVWVNTFYSTSLKHYLYFHFTSCTHIFSWFGDIFPSKNFCKCKATLKFPWKCSRKQQSHLWLVHPEASLAVSLILSFMTRKIWAWRCCQRAFTSYLIQNSAKLSRYFFQPSLVRVSES